jgi:hypothetical protein
MSVPSPQKPGCSRFATFNGSEADRALDPSVLPEGPAALVIGHPGHELLVHGWMELARPRVFVLTDGSGRSTRSRLDSTKGILARNGAQPGPIFGRFTDGSVYGAILHHDFGCFIALTDELATALAHAEIAYVVGDAAEGYNPTHDICRAIIDAAVWLVGRSVGHRPANFDFALAGPPGVCADSFPGDVIRLELDDAAFQRKIRSALGYPELAPEIGLALHGHSHGLESPPPQSVPSGIPDPRHQLSAFETFRVECLRRANSAAIDAEPNNDAPPFYELYGERQVASGYYREVIRYRQHIRPLLEAIQQHVGLGHG